jgi:fucose 4-O-acetylase-like acetyltransferase
MPAFVLVSGYLSRRFRWTKRHFVALITTLLVPYLIFELALALFRVHVAETVESMEVLSPLWLEPHWPMWFLVVLMMWRLVTPILVSHWVMVPLSVGLSLYAGSWDFAYLDLNRFFGLLPYFVVGLHLPAIVLTAARSRWSMLAGIPLLVWLWRVAETTDQRWSTDWFYFRDSYDVLEVSLTEGMEIRAQLIVLGLTATFAFLTLVPRGRSPLTAMGAASMVIYLFHGFVIQWGHHQEWTEKMPQGELESLLTVALCAFALTLALGWTPISRRLSLVADPWNQALAPRVKARTERRRMMAAAVPGSGPATPGAATPGPATPGAGAPTPAEQPGAEGCPTPQPRPGSEPDHPGDSGTTEPAHQEPDDGAEASGEPPASR